MSIGRRIKELREAKNMTRAELAKRLDVTVGAISNYENEVSSPKETILLKIMNALDCDANYLFQDALPVSAIENTLSAKESALIKKYRALDCYGMELLNIVLNKELERVQTQYGMKPEFLDGDNQFTELSKEDLDALQNGFSIEDISHASLA